jgi:hypothetical protein
MLLDRLNSEIFADFLCENVVDFCMAGNSGPLIQGWIMPPGVPSPFPQLHAPMIVQVPQQLLSFHIAIGSS